jgi:hypothetical protein
MSENDLNEIRRGVSMLYRAGDIVEMRVPRKHDVEFSANISGFFDDMELLAQAIYLVNRNYKSTVYTMMNPIKPGWMTVNNKAYVGSKTMREEMNRAGLALEPRMKKSVLWESGKTHWAMRMAEDEDVLKRRWILIDIDAGQPANTNSSDAEHDNTLAMAKAVIQYLTDQGFPAPALTDSGNGHHVYVRVDLENDAASAFLVRRFLKALHQKFAGHFGSAHVDEGMFNAGRITKATGSFVYKGVHTAERPRRRSEVLEFASNKFALRDQLQEIADEYVLAPGETLTSWSEGGGIAIADDEMQYLVDRVKAFLQFYDIEYHGLKQTGDDIVIPCVCPNAAQHSMDGGELECVVMIAASGALSFCCQHAHCQQLRTWKGAKAFLEESTGEYFNWTGASLSLNGIPVVDGKLVYPQTRIPTAEAVRPLRRLRARLPYSPASNRSASSQRLVALRTRKASRNELCNVRTRKRAWSLSGQKTPTC